MLAQKPQKGATGQQTSPSQNKLINHCMFHDQASGWVVMNKQAGPIMVLR